MDIEKVKTILERIVRWHGEFPETGAFHGNDTSRPISYAAAYGSNGERDYMRGLAAQALDLIAAPSHSQQSAATVPDGLHELIKHCRRIGHPCGYSETSAETIHDMQDALRRVMAAINYDRFRSHESEQGESQ